MVSLRDTTGNHRILSHHHRHHAVDAHESDPLRRTQGTAPRPEWAPTPGSAQLGQDRQRESSSPQLGTSPQSLGFGQFNADPRTIPVKQSPPSPRNPPAIPALSPRYPRAIPVGHSPQSPRNPRETIPALPVQFPGNPRKPWAIKPRPPAIPVGQSRQSPGEYLLKQTLGQSPTGNPRKPRANLAQSPQSPPYPRNPWAVTPRPQANPIVQLP